MLNVRPTIRKIFLCNKNKERSIKVKEEYEKKYKQVEFIATSDFSSPLKDADIIVTATASNQPLFDGKLVKKGAHLNCVGSFVKNSREVDSFLISNCNSIVDTIEAEETSGEFCLAKEEGVIPQKTFSLMDLGQFVSLLPSSCSAVRTSPNDITLFKSVGHALQDLSISSFVHQVGKEMGLGINLDFDS